MLYFYFTTFYKTQNRNIARKTLSGMQWASENLPSSYLYSSADDDMMIDVATLDDVIMKTTNTTSRLPYFPFVCIFSMVSVTYLFIYLHLIRTT